MSAFVTRIPILIHGVRCTAFCTIAGDERGRYVDDFRIFPDPRGAELLFSESDTGFIFGYLNQELDKL